MISRKHSRGTLRPARQRGAVTITLSVILLLLITMVAVYTGTTVLFEQKVSANEFRERQAFEAAESGLASAIAYMSSGGGADKDNDGAIDPIFDTNADGVGDVNTTTFASGSSVTVTIGGAFPNFQVVSTGLSDDNTATRVVRTTAGVIDPLPNSPDVPVIARGNVVINGSATVHNPEGHSTIWSGDKVDLGSNNSTATEIADPNDAGYPTCMDTPMSCGLTQSSNKVSIGLDVVENDSSLLNLTAAEMFRNFFGMSPDAYRDSRVTSEVVGANANNLSTDGNPGVHLSSGEVIWVEGNASLTNTTTVGCTSAVTGANVCPNADLQPSIMIVNGDLDTSGTPNFYGLVFVMGDITLSSNNTVTGAIIVAGDSNSTGGSLDVWYNSDVLNQTRNNGPLGGSPGTWRDW